jgi:hypothetical protein
MWAGLLSVRQSKEIRSGNIWILKRATHVLQYVLLRPLGPRSRRPPNACLEGSRRPARPELMVSSRRASAVSSNSRLTHEQRQPVHEDTFVELHLPLVAGPAAPVVSGSSCATCRIDRSAGQRPSSAVTDQIFRSTTLAPCRSHPVKTDTTS